MTTPVKGGNPPPATHEKQPIADMVNQKTREIINIVALTTGTLKIENILALRKDYEPWGL